MSELQLLEELVPLDERPADWDDVVHRARRRRPRARVVAAVAVALAVFGVAPAVAVLLRHDGVKLPAEADRSNVAVVLQPVTRRVLLEAAPWKGHDGFCYELPPVRAGCVGRTRQTVVLRPPLFGWTFDDRIVSGTATTLAGKRMPLIVRHFGGRIDATVFLLRGRLPRLFTSVELRDAGGRVVARLSS